MVIRKSLSSITECQNDITLQGECENVDTIRIRLKRWNLLQRWQNKQTNKLPPHATLHTPQANKHYHSSVINRRTPVTTLTWGESFCSLSSGFCFFNVPLPPFSVSFIFLISSMFWDSAIVLRLSNFRTVSSSSAIFLFCRSNWRKNMGKF